MNRAPAPLGQSRRRRVAGLVEASIVVILVASAFAGSFGVGGLPGSAGGPRVAPPGGASAGPAPVSPAASGTPTLTLTPSSGPVGTDVGFNASSFNHGAAITIKITSTGTVICSGTTSSKGVYTCTYTIPPSPQGLLNFTAATVADAANAPFTVVPHLGANPSMGLVGTPITFVGTGFKTSATDKVEVTWTPPGGGTSFACNNKTPLDANGTFVCSFSMPPAPEGPQAFLAKAINTTSNATGDFGVESGLTVAPTHGPVGTLATFAGTGFTAGAPVSVTWGGVPSTACSSTTLNTGSFSCSFKIPAGTPGGQYVFTGAGNGTSAAANFIVTNLAVAPVAAPVNATVEFTGAGFAPSSEMNVSWKYGYVCTGIDSTPGGTFSCAFRIPASPAGPYVFTASDGQGDYAPATLTVEPFLTLTPGYGPNGTTVQFTGTGFGNDLLVSTTWAPNGSTVTAFSTTTNTNGTFSYAYKVTVPVGGSYLFTATDLVLDSAAATFAVSHLSVTPPSGHNATKITLLASGFAPDSAITLSSSFVLNCVPGGSETPGMTTAEGAYECNATVPFAPEGSYLIVAQVGTDSANATFSVLPHLWSSPAHPTETGKLTFTPTGFAASTVVTVTWASNDTVVCSNTTAANGAINCTLKKIPSIPGGPYVFTATDTDSNTASATVTIFPSLTLNRTSGKSGAPVEFSGAGFAATSAFNVTSTFGLACVGTTAANGSFSCPYTIPNAPTGTYTFTATDALSNTASATFKVGVQLTLSPTTGPVGTLIAFSGTGFAAGHVAKVMLNFSAAGPVVLACSQTVSSVGTFSCSFAFPQATPGKYNFTAWDGSYPKKPYGDNATANFTLTPSLTVTPGSGVVGTPVTFVGQGYTAGVGISVTWDSGGFTACSSVTNVTGTFSCSGAVHPAPAGALVFTAATSAKLSANATFTVLPQLSLSPSKGAFGTAIALNGTGFPASAPVSIFWTGGTACATTASSLGSFTCPTYLVPASPAGTYVFTAKINGTAVTTASFLVEPSLAVSPGAGPIATAVTFRATGFGPSVPIWINSSLGPACSGTSAANGTYSCGYTVPSAPGGSYSFTAVDNQSHSASASFTIGTVLSVSPSLGPVGRAIRFTATAFAASTPITISWSGGTICAGTTGPAGGFVCNATMPAAPLGSHTFTATAGPTATTAFTVSPSLGVSPGSGGSGSTVTFTGTGFPASTSVKVTWSGPTSCSGTTGSSGGFSCSLTIPLGTAGGVYLFTATDTALDNATATFLVVTGLAASPDHGPDLTTITFTGTNFGATVSVSVTSSLGTACTTTTSGAGGFTCTYAIPSGTPGGTYNFTGTDADSNSASVLFVVTFLTASPTGVEVGTNVTLSGGGFAPSGPYSVTAPWGAVAGCSGTTAATGTFTCRTTIPGSATPGQYNFTASDGTDVATAGFGVFSLAAPTAVPGSADVGQAVTFSVVASGGSVLTYSWAGLPIGCPGTGASFSCHPSQPVAGASITVKVTDAAGYNVTSAALLFTVYADPTQAPPTPSEASGDLDHAVTFTASVSGGSGGGTYAWTSAAGLGCVVSTSATLSCTPSATGSFAVSYLWTDSNGVVATGSTSLSFTVNGDPLQGPPTPSQSGADLGQTISFLSSVSDGSGAGSYAWTFSAGLGCTASTTSRLVCTPSASGTFSVSYQWTDSDGLLATGSTSLSYTVSGDPSIGTPTANVTSSDVNQAVTFQVSASGGSGGLTIAWHGLPPGCAGSGATFSCTPDGPVSGATITATVTDSNVYNVTSAALTFTVYADPTVGTPTATVSSVSVTSIDVGQTVTFSASASGGLGPLAYAWPVVPPGCSGSGTTFTCKPTGPVTNASITVVVTDANHFVVTSAALVFTVNADPAQAPPTPSHPAADVGYAVTFTASVSAGSGGGTYAWSAAGLGCAASTGPTLTCTPPTTGTFTLSYQWTDSSGLAATGSTTLSFAVNVDPTVAAVTPHPSGADVGQGPTFTATAAGGTGAYSYAWTASSGFLGCTFVNAASITCKPTLAGNYTVTVVVTDANGVSSPAFTSAMFQVDNPPSATAPAPSSPSRDAGQSLTFKTTVTGGAGTLTYVWTATGLGCSLTNTATIMCTPSQKGTYTVTVNVTDANLVFSGAQSTSYTVYAAPTLTTPSASLASADTGQTVTFTTTPANGFGAFTYTWTAPQGLNCTLANAPAISCVPVTNGTFAVTVSAVDANLASTGAMTLQTFKVYLAPTVTTPLGNRTSADVRQTVTFNTTATGGSGTLTYAWAWSSAMNCTNPVKQPFLQISCSPTTAGVYTVSVNATDKNGVTSPAGTLSFTVYNRPVVVLTVSPSSVLQGHTVTFTATASGGFGAYTYAWAELPPGCSVPKSSPASFSCTPSDEGSYTVLITAKDANNGTGLANVTLTVRATFLGLPALEGYAIVAGAVAAALVAVGVGMYLVLKKRRGKRQQMQF